MSELSLTVGHPTGVTGLVASSIRSEVFCMEVKENNKGRNTSFFFPYTREWQKKNT